VSRTTAAPRRLDGWAAVLLGVLVTLGVIILFATPGPWHRVVPAVAQHPPLAPAPPPRDIAVFVKGPDGQGCAGVVWLHVSIAESRFTAVVVPARLTCELPGGGLQPLDEIVDQAGPNVAAHALGARLSVTFGAWLTIDPLATRTALPGLITLPTPVHGRATPLVGIWATNQSPTRAVRRQVAYLQTVLKSGLDGEINLVAFVNYILGSTDVDTGLKLEAASAIGAALDKTDPGDLVTSSLPVTVDRRGHYERWLPQAVPLLALRQSFAFDAMSPVYGATVRSRPAGRTVLVLTSPLGRRAAAYRAAFASALRGYGVRDVVVRLRTCTSAEAVGRVLAQGDGAAAPLGVVVALGRPGAAATPSADVRATLAAALAGVRSTALPAVVSQVPGAGVAVNRNIAAQAAGAGLPLSPVAAVLEATARATTPSATPGAGQSPVSAPPSASPATSVAPAVAAERTISPAEAARWARLDAATFVRVVQPAFFAPRLVATRLGVSYYERTLTRVAVVGPAASAAGLAARLDVFGYAAQATATAGGFPSSVKTIVYYNASDKLQALALAGDLGLPASQTARSSSGSAPVTVVLPG